MLEPRYAENAAHMGAGMRAVIFPVLCVFAVLIAPVSASAQKSRTCAPSAIRAAAAKQVAPNLVGCRYNEVAVPLVRYFSIFPVLTRTSGDSAASVILEQKPAAGEPLTAGGQLALSISAAQPKPQETTVVEAPVAAPPAEPAPLAVSVSAAPVERVELPAISQVSAKKGPPLRLPSLNVGGRPSLSWVWLGVTLAGFAAVVLVFRGRRRRSPEQGFDRVAKVTARLEYGPGRLNAHGPLVVGREGGQ